MSATDSESGGMAPGEFSELSPAQRQAAIDTAKDIAGGNGSAGGGGGLLPNVSLSVPENLPEWAKKAGKVGMRTGKAPRAEGLSEEYGIGRGPAHLARAGMKAMEWEDVPEDPPVFVDVIVGIVHLIREGIR